MKAIYLICFVLLLSACKDEDIKVADLCEGDCLHAKSLAKGTVSFTNCYDRWAITFDDENSPALIINPANKLQQEGLRVEVAALFFENDIPFLFPDPPGPAKYKIEILDYNILD